MRKSYWPSARTRLTTAVTMLCFAAACSGGSAARIQDQSENAPEQRTMVRDGQSSGKVAEVQTTDLEQYVGSYEGRNISLSSSTLFYHREGMPSPAALKQVGEDHFEVDVPPGARVRSDVDGKIPTFRFNRDSSGKVESLSVVNPDNSIQATFKRTS